MRIVTIILILIFGIFGPILVKQNIPKAGLDVPKLAKSIVTPKSSFSVAGWYPYWDKAEAQKSFGKNARNFDEISPFWYDLKSNGSIARIENDPYLVKIAKKHQVKVIPMISNNFDGLRVSRIINNRNLKKQHIHYIVKAVQKGRFDGIELDYEGLIPSDRKAFSVFVRDLARELHKRDKILSVTLMSKVKEPGTNSTSKAQDWKVLGKHADRLRIMAYDYHWKTSGPGPIAPYKWVRDIVRLAVKEMPREKVVLGIGTYGYRWDGGRARAVDFRNAPVKAFRRDKASKELRSQDKRTWLQDSGSLQHKLEIVKNYKIRGIVFWKLGGEDPRTWDVIKKNK